MSPDAQRVAIAEACGWIHTQGEKPRYGGWYAATYWTKPDGVRVAGCWLFKTYGLPDYLHDLNAMHEAEKVLLKNDALLWHKYASHLDENYINQPYTVGATATQRAEALLRTIGVWEDGK